jgi:hypothetical protein
MMKILSIDKKGNMIKVKTDHPQRPEFAYFKDQFATFNDLEAEMERSIKASTARTEKQVLREMQLDKEVKEAMAKYEKELKDGKQ